MDCPACKKPESRVKDTFKGAEEKRKRMCFSCGVRWKTTETVDKGSIEYPIGSDQSPPISTNGNRLRRVTPNPDQSQPIATGSGGGVGGAPPSESDPDSGSQSAPLSDPDLPPKGDQGVDRAKQTRPDSFSAHFGGSGAAFGKVYAAYPNKVGRSAASTVFAELASVHPRGADGLADDVLAAFETGMLARYPYVINGEGKWPALEKFLAARRWEDEPNAEDAPGAPKGPDPNRIGRQKIARLPVA